jgi:hypothetical protein
VLLVGLRGLRFWALPLLLQILLDLLQLALGP